MPTSDPIRHETAEVYPARTPSALIKIILIILLLVCLARMPYGYYQLVRFVAFVAFAVLAFQYLRIQKITYAIFFGSLSVLFQPFMKIALGRTIWNAVDVTVAVILLITLISDRKSYEK